ncbi:hypothetical protein IQ07DRAFT_506185 [Pyrenochaeta sp. DS3sAY3a]|nr:hypothetical protein IQ07DRAFT_506185 [Pyrenochaeta sp. DS3sAY3a]
MASGGNWVWSTVYKDYYYDTVNAYGQPVRVFAQQLAANPAPAPDSTQERVVPNNVRVTIPSFIAGTPETGWVEGLDSTYQMRNGLEARRFFVVGKVFSMLHSEPAGGQSAFDEFDEAYSFVRFGEMVYSTIRRFIVVEVRQGFVYALAISTYSNRGTLKPGCIPYEHTVVFSSGTDYRHCYFPGEYERGMTKQPIEVEPAHRSDPNLLMKRESRIRFSKQFAIEMNVKVKDLGHVRSEYMSTFLNYYREYIPR